MSIDKNTINNYNNFSQKWNWYERDKWNLARDYVEKPAMFSQLDDLLGKSVLCIGCGSGEECEYLKRHGAKKIVGIDISTKLISIAKKNVPNCQFFVVDMEKLSFPDDSFDIVYSSLAIHYLKDWKKTLHKIYKVLKPTGTFIFSIPHPIKWSSKSERNEEKQKASFLLGYTNNKQTGEFHIYGDYLNARKITDKWFNGELTVSFYSKPLSTIFKEIQKSGFQILEFLEPTAIEKTKKINLTYWKIRHKIPLFIVFKLGKIH